MVWPEYHPSNSIPAEGVLAVVSFGGDVVTDALTVRVPIPQCGAPVAEVWRTQSEPRRGRYGSIEFATTDDVMFGWFVASGADTQSITARAYDEMVSAACKAGYPYLLRVWNHLGGINEPEGELERYKRFSAGRHDALMNRGYGRQTFPAASAVGSSRPGLVTYFIAGRSAGVHVENPRQVPAYDYPPEHGPRAPSFARATVSRWNGHSVLFVSGTAAVVGHETRHIGNVDGQIDETLLNLERIIAEGSKKAGREKKPTDLAVAKVYIRRPADRELVASRLRRELPQTQILFLASDICRLDLLLEIDGVVLI